MASYQTGSLPMMMNLIQRRKQLYAQPLLFTYLTICSAQLTALLIRPWVEDWPWSLGLLQHLEVSRHQNGGRNNDYCTMSSQRARIG